MDFDEMRAAYLRATEDDIVTRLRRVPEKIVRMSGSELNPWYQRCVEAADEIERLRKQIRDTWELVDATGECWNPHDCELCQSKAKAVRGG